VLLNSKARTTHTVTVRIENSIVILVVYVPFEHTEKRITLHGLDFEGEHKMKTDLLVLQ
jgi:hypothetical protein